MELRHYQDGCVGAAYESFKQGNRRHLAVGPTGCGKTVIFAHIIGRCVRFKHPVWVMAPRRELVKQASRHLDGMGIDHAVMMAGHPRQDPTKPVQVCSRDTFGRRSNYQYPNEPRLIIIDEAHNGLDAQLAIMQRFPDSKMMGVTATPLRADGRGLGEIYETIDVFATTRQGITEGWLKPYIYNEWIPVDTKGLKTRGADYDNMEAGERMSASAVVSGAVEKWIANAKGRPTFGFANSVPQSRRYVEAFRAAGIRAAHIDANTPEDERDRVFAALKSRELDILWNVDVCSEGVDCPAVSAVMFACLTKSERKFLQQAGRGLRPEHKFVRDGEHAVFMDLCGLYTSFGALDLERQFSLAGKRGAEQIDADKRRETAPRSCETCGSLLSRASVGKCLLCGAVLPDLRALEEVDARELRRYESLQETKAIVKAYTTTVAQATLQERIAYWKKVGKEAMLRGYQPGWAMGRFHHRFGDWPTIEEQAAMEWKIVKDQNGKKIFAPAKERVLVAGKLVPVTQDDLFGRGGDTHGKEGYAHQEGRQKGR